ncbi:hypothetical protein PoB_007082000 [Plakobranchus ocellatus]|uniref:Uncharacterized protein n=1 Tax=Plakobranchus ocellatus TaxID=259542 RepID=A0AAV4DK06_9GAST|nr:hypothetical protein PoB_007082000 [Plakobranchus ocellatus]
MRKEEKQARRRAVRRNTMNGRDDERGRNKEDRRLQAFGAFQDVDACLAMGKLADAGGTRTQDLKCLQCLSKFINSRSTSAMERKNSCSLSKGIFQGEYTSSQATTIVLCEETFWPTINSKLISGFLCVDSGFETAIERSCYFSEGFLSNVPKKLIAHKRK